jgi:hypothetical protein
MTGFLEERMVLIMVEQKRFNGGSTLPAITPNNRKTSNSGSTPLADIHRVFVPTRNEEERRS